MVRYSTHLYAEESVRIIEEHGRKEEKERSPFFLYLPFQALHAPMQVTPPSWYLPDLLQVPGEYLKLVQRPGVSEERLLVLAMLAAMDEAIGQVVDALKASGEYDNTAIVFTTDNGGSVSHRGSNLPLRGTKGTLWEGGTRGPAFVHSPLLPPEARGTTHEGAGCSATPSPHHLAGLFHITDWMPTLASLAGVSKERVEELGMDGIDQTDMLLHGGQSGRTEFVYNIKTSPFKAGYR